MNELLQTTLTSEDIEGNPSANSKSWKVLGIDLIFTVIVPLTILAFAQATLPQHASSPAYEGASSPKVPPFLIIYYYSQLILATYCIYLRMTYKEPEITKIVSAASNSAISDIPATTTIDMDSDITYQLDSSNSARTTSFILSLAVEIYILKVID